MTDDAGTSEADESGRIERLDNATIDRIAAGEVVERPASAVKELVENAIDAEASRVSVSVESGGIEGITVADNGIGMSEADVRKAIEKHTTSKIAAIEDLESGVSSLGFRGEALAAIGAVAQLTIRTKPRGGARGTELVVRGGEIESVSPVGCPAGTTIEVRDLFYNVPARKKYLKRESTEFAHVNRILTGYALANPGVAISLEHGSRETFATSGSGDRREAVLATYGREVAGAMIPLDAGSDGDSDGGDENGGIDEERSPIAAIRGLVSDPETTRANPAYVTTIVNGRYVTAGALREAIVAAYGGQLAPDRYPFAVLDVEVPAEAVDANVHPRKLEVRFENEQTVREAIEARVEQALLDAGLVRSGAPRGRSAPTQTRIEPEASDGKEKEPGTREGDSGAENASEEPSANTGRERSAAPAAQEEKTSRAETAATGESIGGDAENERGAEGVDGPSDEADGRDRQERGRPTGGDIDQTPGESEGSSSDRGTRALDGNEGDGHGPDGSGDPTDEHDTSEPPASERCPAVDLEGTRDLHAHIEETAARSSEETTNRFSAGEQRALSGERVDRRHEFERLPELRVLGQFDETYVVAETSEGLVLIDQHAADERVTYERLRERLPRGEAQTLAEPVEIELTAGEAALFESAIDTLAGLGFYASLTESEGEDREENEDRTGKGNGKNGDGDTVSGDNEAGEGGQRTVAVRTVPAAIAGCDPALLRDVLGAFVAAERPGKTVEAAADALLADLACYPSITGNTSLSTGSIVDLLNALDACENPYACPHGRPVMIEFGSEEINDRFERDYPGHAGRRSE
ncbi:DNA mismatch repair protein MutL [Halobacteriales archaeon QS_3_64_16]|nr:MAG: DNA mismatch repair protein MutL [Halobacteriales archaeon QS_3_64_16]